MKTEVGINGIRGRQEVLLTPSANQMVTKVCRPAGHLGIGESDAAG
jgi:hypothetical protein